MTPRPSSLCQLAGTYNGTLPDGGLMYEEKIDGWRGVYAPDHTGRRRLFTRNGQVIEGAAHILWRLDQMEEAAGEPTVFDGEFQVDGNLASTKYWAETGWRGGGDAGQFFVFDAIPLREWQAGGSGRPLIERKAILKRIIETPIEDDWTWRPKSHGRDDGTSPVVLLPDGWVFDARDVMAEAQRVWARDGEGLMLKDPLAPYIRGRSNAWLKVKSYGAWRKRAA